MRVKLFIAGVLAAVGTLSAGCELLGGDSGGKGRSTIEIPDVPGAGTFNEAWLRMQSCGESTIEGIYATNFQFNIYSSETSDLHMGISVLAFHRSEAFATGTYTFPSTDTGTATGSVNISTSDESLLDKTFNGYIVGGSVTISNSGKDYSVTFNNVVVLSDDGSQKNVSFSYKGMAEKEDVSSWMGGRGPEYGVSSTVEDAIGGEKFPRLGLRRRYHGATASGMHDHNLILTPDINDWGSGIDLHLYTLGRELTTGTYTANIGEVGSVEGRVMDADFGGEIIDGSVTLAVEANGMYRITMNDLRVGIQNPDYETRLAKYTGAWTGGGEFTDFTLDPAYPPTPAEPQYGGTTTFTLPGGVVMEGVKAGGQVVTEGNWLFVRIEKFILPAASIVYSTDNRVEFQINLAGTEFAPGTYTYAENFDESGIGSFDISLRYPRFDEGGAIVGGGSASLTAGMLTARESGGIWELELSDTATNDPALPTFDGAYTGRISFTK